MDAMPKEAAAREHLDEIRTPAKRASELTDQMLAYSGKGAKTQSGEEEEDTGESEADPAPFPGTALLGISSILTV